MCCFHLFSAYDYLFRLSPAEAKCRHKVEDFLWDGQFMSVLCFRPVLVRVSFSCLQLLSLLSQSCDSCCLVLTMFIVKCHSCHSVNCFNHFQSVSGRLWPCCICCRFDGSDALILSWNCGSSIATCSFCGCYCHSWATFKLLTSENTLEIFGHGT